MPLSLRRGRVTGILEQHDDLIRLEVDGVPCVAYPELTGPIALDDEVLVNSQARDLELGSGGFDVLYANLTRGLELPAGQGAHVVKLPYTPAQFAALHAEEGAELAAELDGMPVVCCSLHVQLEGGALPLGLSDTVRTLRQRGLLSSTVSQGACFGGEVECVNVASALAWAAATGHQAVVCAVGPGIVGTASRLGHGGVAAAAAANFASALGGSPVLAVRVSSADQRERHRGVSHHTRAVVELCLGDVRIAWPKGLEAPEWLEPREDVSVEGWDEACAGLPLSHMGRGPDLEPWFFAAAFAAGRVARGLLP
jgi:hypothetical protein